MRRLLLIALGVLVAALVIAFLGVGLFPPKMAPHEVQRAVAVDTIAPLPPPPPAEPPPPPVPVAPSPPASAPPSSAQNPAPGSAEPPPPPAPPGGPVPRSP